VVGMQGTISIQKLSFFKSFNLELPCTIRDITLRQSITISIDGLPIKKMSILEYGESIETKGK
jgi:hypothetical protein